MTDQNNDRFLPNPLVTTAGETVTTVEQWERVRRPEVMEHFRTCIYGREPVQRPQSLRFLVIRSEPAFNGEAVRKEVELSYEGSGGTGGFRLLLFVPSKRSKPAPAFLLISTGGQSWEDLYRASESSFWPVQQLISRGYAAAAFLAQNISPDTSDALSGGVHRIFDQQNESRPGDAWGTIAAWAWGAGRAMDYLEEDPDIDHQHVAVVGHSRGGKTSLWAGACDDRFDLVVVNNSGSTGAAVARGKQGETIRRINDRFPHWFCGNYKSFNDKECELPVDQHTLVASIAPRHVYVTSASEDAWADPESEFLSLVHASPVYELYGYESWGGTSFPEPEQPIHSTRIGYHLRTGKHDMTEYDWSMIMNYADRAWVTTVFPG